MSEYTYTKTTAISELDDFIKRVYEEVARVSLETGMVPLGININQEYWDKPYVEVVIPFGRDE